MNIASHILRNPLRVLALLILCSSSLPTYAQFRPRPGGMMGGPPPSPRFSGSTAKLFGDNSAFSATMEMQSKDPDTAEILTMPGRIAFAEGKSRFEMDMAKIKGGKIPQDAAAQMQTMGMDRTVMISRPDKRLAYMIYPGLQAYVESPLEDSEMVTPAKQYKVQTTELGRETVDGHPCVKNRTVVTGSNGEKHEATVWNAIDLKDFPIKIEQIEQGRSVTMLFKDIKLSQPEASLFEPPSGFTRHESIQAMIQQVMMKRIGGDQGFPMREK